LRDEQLADKHLPQNDPVAAAAAGTTERSAAGYVAMVAVYLNAFIICATWQGITWTYASEIFPLDIRMLCVSLTTADTWLGSFIIARSTPYMISDLGYGVSQTITARSAAISANVHVGLFLLRCHLDLHGHLGLLLCSRDQG